MKGRDVGMCGEISTEDFMVQIVKKGRALFAQNIKREIVTIAPLKPKTIFGDGGLVPNKRGGRTGESTH